MDEINFLAPSGRLIFDDLAKRKESGETKGQITQLSYISILT